MRKRDEQGHMNLTEKQFREDLQQQALACDWDAWHVTRLIFADWLAERADPEEAAARADWQLASKPIQLRNQKHPWCYLFRTFLWWRPRFPRFRQAHNAQWLLGFPPLTLKLRAISLDGAVAGRGQGDWTWVPSRHRSRWKKMDNEIDQPLGLLALFLEPKQVMPLFDSCKE